MNDARRVSGMKVYTARTVARMLEMSVGQIRSFARAGFLHPDRGPRGEFRFSFQDLVLLRTAKGLLAARIPPRKVRRALRRLERQLSTGRPLTGVLISAEGERIIVRDGESIWNPDSGQAHFNFGVSDIAQKVAPHARRLAEQGLETDEERDADYWYALASDLEISSPAHAREAYRRALDLDPNHVETRVNLGRLLHEEGKLHAAEAHYRLALAVRHSDATALFNLAVCLEDLRKPDEAILIYQQTIEIDPQCADAYYNVARLYDRKGDAAAALRHLKTYRKLTEAH